VPPEAIVLIVEDEDPQRTLIGEILRKAGFEVEEASSADHAADRLKDRIPDLILCDWRMPGRSGGELLDQVRERDLGCGFIVMTAYGSIAHAVEAVRHGADDYLAKPFEREALLLAVRRVLKTRRLEDENRRLREAAEDRDRFGQLIGRAPSMQRLYRAIEKVAATDATVLVTGESGTGKELVARMLHGTSRRSGATFVAVNCAAIPATLIESELFGHERGAFTGAHRRRLGRFEEAESGTLFLDDVQSLPLELQPKLLRVLQERCFTRLGGVGEVGCDVRVVAATNRNLAELVADGSFREDLYYRLDVVPLMVPPLRERREDIPLLAGALFDQACRRHGCSVRPLPPAVLRRFMGYHWPGNVRELANVVERLVLLAEDGRVREEDLPDEVLKPHGDAAAHFRLPPQGLEWDELEADLLRQALAAVDGNRTQAARLLGLSYKTFLYRVEKHHL
jgi:DNA-binding NtrC family response regulator